MILQQQVKELKEAQVVIREQSDSAATETDSGWGSDEDANRSHLCEMTPTYETHLQLTAPIAYILHLIMETQRKLKDVTLIRQSKEIDHPMTSLVYGTLTRATVTKTKANR